MKTIHLLRHAKSSWDDAELPDLERPLSSRGHRDARTLARALEREGFVVDRVLCSPARRARETCEPIAESLAGPVETRYVERLFEASAETIRHVLAAETKGANRVLVVAHNPGLESLLTTLDLSGDAELLAALRSQIPTATLVTLELDRSLRKGVLVAARRARNGGVEGAFEVARVTAVTARKVELDAHTSRRVAASALLDAARAHVMGNLRGAEDGVPECVHQFRVALRRLRVALWVFRRELEPGSRALRRELRRLGRALGPLRDAHVLAASIGDAPDSIELLHALAETITAEEHEVRRALRGRRGRAALEAVRALSIRDPSVDKPLAKLARDRIAKRAAAALEYFGAIGTDDSAAIHELRKELKKLRYTLAMVGGTDHAELARDLGRMQDALGALQDRVSATCLFDEHLAVRIAPSARKRARATVLRRFDGSRVELGDVDGLRARLSALATR